MHNTTVWLKRCLSYDDQAVYAAVEVICDGCGFGAEAAGKTVMFKVNAATGGSPDLARCTHPAVVGALVRYAFSHAASKVYVADSCAVYGCTTAALSRSGITASAEQHGATVINIDALPPRLIPADTPLPLFSGDLVLTVDILVSVAKLKTHSFTGFTGTVKNMMGVIQGAQKARMHKALRRRQFYATLARVCTGIRPAYGIIDGIIGMEGNGPSDGQPRWIGLLAASRDLVAVDAAVSSLAGLGPEHRELLSTAQAAGVGTMDHALIDTRGDDIPPLDPPLRPPSRLFTVKERMAWTHALFYRLREQSTFPAVTNVACSQCGLCEHNCPVGAVTRTRSFPVINYRVCCRCFYCSEACPTGTIAVQTDRLLGTMVRARMNRLNLVNTERSNCCDQTNDPGAD